MALFGGIASLTQSISSLLDQADEATAESLASPDSGTRPHTLGAPAAAAMQVPVAETSSLSATTVSSPDDATAPAAADASPRLAAQPPVSAPPSAPAPHAATTSDSELHTALAERTAEVASLTKVWNESRAKLARMQAALERAQELRATEIEACERRAQDALDAAAAQHRAALDEERRLRTADAQLAQSSVGDHDRRVADERVAASEARAAAATAIARSAALEQTCAELQAEVAAQRASAAATAEAHALVVRSMREEFAAHEAARDEEARVLASTRHAHTRSESSFESNALESSHALAAVHRELEDKSAQLQKLHSERRWIEADRDAARTELSTARERSLSEHAAWARERADVAERLRELRAVEEQHRIQMQASVEARAADQRTITALRAQLAQAAAAATAASAHASTLNGTAHSVPETGDAPMLTSLTDQLLAKQAQLEQSMSAHAVARMQLQQQITRADLLQQQVDLLRADLDDVPALPAASSTSSSAADLELGGAPAPTGGATAGGLLRTRWAVVKGGERATATRTIESLRELRSAPSLSTTLGVLDSLGAMLGALLRGRPALRVAFIVYIVLVHLYTVVMVSHVMDHLPAHVKH